MEPLLLQQIIQKLDDIEPIQPVEKTLLKIQSALNQFAAIWKADAFTFYICNPWSGEYELRHVAGIRQREFMWDPPHSSVTFHRTLELLDSDTVWANHYHYIPDVRVSDAMNGTSPASFVAREGIVSSAVLFSFPLGASPAEAQNAVLFLSWRERKDRDQFRDHVEWIRLFSESLHHAVNVLIRESVPNPEIIGRHTALADKMSRDLPGIIAGGATVLAERLAELAGRQTHCTIYEVLATQPSVSLREIASTLPVDQRQKLAAGYQDRVRICDRAAELNKVIYVDDFSDPEWLSRYLRPSKHIASELAIPIADQKDDGSGTVRYVLSLHRSTADAFTYDEINLLRGSANHLRTVLAKAYEAVDAVCHDIRNVALVLDDQQITLEGGEGFFSAKAEDILALALVTRWAAANSPLMAAGICAFPRDADRTYPTDVKRVVDCVARAEKVLNDNTQFTTVVEEGLTTTAPSVIGQILWNLVHNAGKFANREEPKIEIRAASDGEFLRLSVTDNGPGLPPDAEAIFLPRWSGGTGQGWGLFIVRTCARALGGSVSARNRDDGQSGAVFVVELPA